MPKTIKKLLHEDQLVQGAEVISISTEAAEEICREPACNSLATTAHYCRAHYIKNWAAIKEKEEIIREGRLYEFIQDLFNRYSESVIKMIRHDLSTQEGFDRACDSLGIREGLGDIVAIDTDAVDSASLFPVSPEGEAEENKKAG